MSAFKRVFEGAKALNIIRELSGFLSGLPPGKKYCVEVKKHRNKRSRDANSYAWVLIGQIATAQGIPPDEVYRRAIEECGGTFHMMPVQNEAMEVWSHNWAAGRLGWWVEPSHPTKGVPGYTTCRCWYGSSVFSTKEMANLIDYLVTDAKELGIDTTTPDERKRLIEEWGQ